MLPPRALALLALLALLLPAPALALSCAPLDLARSLAKAAASPAPFAILHGRLDFDEALMPAPFEERLRDPAAVPARFEGRALGPEGFGPGERRDVTIRPTCAGPWCASLPTGRDRLLLACLAPDGSLAVEVGPCGGTAFPEPDAADLALAEGAGR